MTEYDEVSMVMLWVKIFMTSALEEQKKIKIKDKINRLHMLTRQMNVRRLVDSIREAVLTVSPNKQYRGILYPTNTSYTRT